MLCFNVADRNGLLDPNFQVLFLHYNSSNSFIQNYIPVDSAIQTNKVIYMNSCFLCCDMLQSVAAYIYLCPDLPKKKKKSKSTTCKPQKHY